MPSTVLIVTPYAAAANNGNVRTAQRWATQLSSRHRVIVRTTEETLDAADVLIALHARRSHEALRSWCERKPRRPSALCLTGTDLYHDLPANEVRAHASLRLADRLIVLQDAAVRALPDAHQAKADVVFQSASALSAFHKSPRRLRVLFVGHLRPEKDPLTFLRAAAACRDRTGIEFAMVGAMRDQALEGPLRSLHESAPNVRLLGPLDHARTRERIRRAHTLVVPSRMEGGANVIVEAVLAKTAVIASDCDGNIGMLGADYPAFFPVGDEQKLAALLTRCHTDSDFLRRLEQACARRASLFAPDAERDALLAIVDRLLANS